MDRTGVPETHRALARAAAPKAPQNTETLGERHGGCPGDGEQQLVAFATITLSCLAAQS